MREYVAQTAPGAEAVSVTNLRASGFEAFNPTLVIKTRVRGKPIEFLRPWFPLYVFVRMDVRSRDLDWRLAARTKGVKSFLGPDPEHPTALPVGSMAALFDHLDTYKIVSGPDLEVIAGASVRVTSGSFQGLIGTCLQSNMNRVKVLLSLFGGAVPVSFGRDAVEAVG